MKDIYYRSIFALLALAIIGCSQKDDIETESIYNQLLISEQRNADEVHKMLKTIYWHEQNAKQEDIDVANEVRSLLNLKKSLGIKMSQEKSNYVIATKLLQTYFDSLSAHLLKFDSGYYMDFVQKAQSEIRTLDNRSLDGQYHQLLIFSGLERNLFTYYRNIIGISTFDIFYPCVAFRKKILFANQKNQIVITPVAKEVNRQFDITYFNSRLYKEGSETALPHSFKQLGNASIAEFIISEPGKYEFVVGVYKSPSSYRSYDVIEKFEVVEETSNK